MCPEIIADHRIEIWDASAKLKRFIFWLSQMIVASHSQSFLGDSYYLLPTNACLPKRHIPFLLFYSPKHPSQSPSRHCLMITNQIAGYKSRFRSPRALYSLERCGSLVGIYIFFTSGMAETPKKYISNVNISASCDTLWHRCLLGESKSSGKCNRSSPPDRVDRRWRSHLLRVRKLWSRFVCLYEVLQETNSIRESN